ncbi:MAG: four helix bundle protein [Candidatus Sungbacteria bacterium]|uniref:Four helix bundle protein n=1 Tax=Candidatus Sungiibacteriota bacterium TaxID=2750080 RepID=A0A932YWK5_9BACT|nr:four helix bundle protein [Candidatus Sungbacteria bacterium]
MHDESKIRNFTDLNAWKEAHALVLYVYRLTRTFPKEEQFGLVIQLRRAAVSITSNIAEGFSRTSLKEKAQFYSMALGSLTEVENQLITAKDLGYFQDEAENAAKRLMLVNKLINGLIRKTRSWVRNS